MYKQITNSTEGLLVSRSSMRQQRKMNIRRKEKLRYLPWAKRTTEAVQGTHQCLNTRAVDIQSEPTGQKVQYNSKSNGSVFPSI